MKGAVKMTGREKCRILKEMRRAYVKAEELDLIIADCNFKGDCPGTCPSCEAEMRTISKLLADKTYKNACEASDDDGFTLTEWLEDGRNTEVVVISCRAHECNTINCELEELGLSEYTF
jgi:hypothetical protein